MDARQFFDRARKWRGRSGINAALRQRVLQPASPSARTCRVEPLRNGLAVSMQWRQALPLTLTLSRRKRAGVRENLKFYCKVTAWRPRKTQPPSAADFTAELIGFEYSGG
jgi:hypothetical protein